MWHRRTIHGMLINCIIIIIIIIISIIIIIIIIIIIHCTAFYKDNC